MPIHTLMLPILIGLISAILLLSILYKDEFIKQTFSDLGALIQLQTSRPYYMGIGLTPLNYDAPVPRNPTQGQITQGYNSGFSYPVYNYYPKTPLHLTSIIPLPLNPQSPPLDLAFSNPEQIYNSHKTHYWELSGGFPYPVVASSVSNMDKVHAVENKKKSS